jgi:hypothetical protein
VSNAAAGFGAGFDPATGMLHVVSTADDNLTVDPSNAATTTGPTLAYAAGDPTTNPNPSIAGIAYVNNGSATPQLYGIDSGQDSLVLIDPVAGVDRTVGKTNIDVTSLFGFDISKAPSGDPGTTLLAGQLTTASPSGSSLLAINRTTGRATNLGRIGTDTSLAVVAFSVLPI